MKLFATLAVMVAAVAANNPCYERCGHKIDECKKNCHIEVSRENLFVE